MKKNNTHDNKIDFVVLWVDGNDPEWQKEKNNYNPKKDTDSTITRYRDWNILKYWFRAVEKNAPWVNKIFFVTNGQKPEWLNIENEKIVHIKHSDYIKKEALPTFNANPIELNLHRISGLSEKFVYFNDDMFLLNKARPSLFFKNNLPCDSAIVTPFFTTNNTVSTHLIINDLEEINNNYSKHDVVKKNLSKWYNLKYGTKLLRTTAMMPYKKFPGLYYDHQPTSFLKKSYEQAWKKFGSIFESTTKNRFRSKDDANQWLIKWMQICEGNFTPRKPCIGENLTITDKNYKEICEKIKHSKKHTICINDADTIKNFNLIQKELIRAFEEKFPNKSIYEK